MWQTILSGQPWQGDFKNRRQNGDPFWVIASISPVKDTDGEITHFVSSQEDITERCRVEAQLVQAQKMEGLGQLVSGVAHDFNNLLTGVVGFTDLCLEMVDENDALRGNLQQIGRAGESARALTRQLLAFGRQQVMENRVVDLNQVIRGFEGLLRRTISENVELELEVGAEPGKVKVDPSQMEQILVNLAVNAQDAMPGGGRLTITTSSTEPISITGSDSEGARPEGYVCLAVADTGIGMDEQVMSRAFEPFFTTKERERGTGLGLATVYGIVKQSGGHIELESETGNGTTFRVFLPCVSREVSSEPARSSQPMAKNGSERVLLVEDDDLVRAFAGRLLTARGYEVVESGDPGRALEIGNGDRFDLLITDVVMPGMSGRELAAELGRSRPDLKVLFLSGYSDTEIVEAGSDSARTTFLPKPFGAEDLARVVRNLLDAPG